jgi:ABC-2 type transport system ATP-binding protein
VGKKLVSSLLIPTSGTARVLGHDVVKQADAIRPRIGFIFGGERGLYWRLSGVDNLRYFASLYHVAPAVSKKRIPYLLELVGLADRGQEKVEGYSRGMKQRLHVARTLLHDPEVLFLDEPTIGLDPVGAREVRQVIRNLQAENKTILLTTHYMFEADALCQRIAVIDHGRIVALDTPEGLKRHVQDLSVIELEVFGVALEVLDRLRALPFVDTLSVENREQKQALLIHSPRGSAAVPDLLAALNGLLMGCLSLITRNMMFVNNTVYFLLLVFCGANVPLTVLPGWMRAVSQFLPLTRGIASARQIIAGAGLSEVVPLLAGELLIGLVYIFLGYSLFRWFEFQAKRHGTLEAI